MKYYIKLSLILLIFCAVASGILAYINTLTAPVIAQRKAKEEIATREALIPNANFTQAQTADGASYFVASNPETQEILGYTFIAAEIGYSSTVQTMVGVDKDFKVLGIKIIDQAETPGLGANCTNDNFTSQYAGMTIENLYVDKDGGAVIALSGATITSRCITNSIRNRIQAVKSDISAGGIQ
ncbi:MAG: FMN-binding protein [Candidatus Cloacimonetes bacterium]|jgi:electron transport complex protein RnfG|nr:FMN-binding protein [Candidatus Cloacimonadota bacterium]MDY0299169.1 FMN-binding protein [Candidatus Cloacimonadaceae bacterium]MCB5279835.1 FMN-binding protein [Candidatus Cloacimonadota bacterium]MCK9332070.1 FMN-binding protein [Candidatus Cloacimonadota bacterium]MDD2210925.1 FMN-binding protein [Candidatus Cloacimonadota bacterium]